MFAIVGGVVPPPRPGRKTFLKKNPSVFSLLGGVCPPPRRSGIPLQKERGRAAWTIYREPLFYQFYNSYEAFLRWGINTAENWGNKICLLQEEIDEATKKANSNKSKLSHPDIL